MKNYKPLYEVRGPGEDFLHGIHPDDLDEYRKHTELTSLSHKEKVRIIAGFRTNPWMTRSDIAIINKILGDHQILDKIVIVKDGSYRHNRIWINIKKIDIAINVEVREKSHYSSKYDHDPIRGLNYIKNNFEKIFFQISDSTDEDNHFPLLYHPSTSDFEPEFEYGSAHLRGVCIIQDMLLTMSSLLSNKQYQTNRKD